MTSSFWPTCDLFAVRYQVPRYSGWKLLPDELFWVASGIVRYQVPRYSGWKPSSRIGSTAAFTRSDTKYRVIADGNFFVNDGVYHYIAESDTKYRVIADGNSEVAFATRLATMSDTKYRVIADGNPSISLGFRFVPVCQIPSTAL